MRSATCGKWHLGMTASLFPFGPAYMDETVSVSAKSNQAMVTTLQLFQIFANLGSIRLLDCVSLALAAFLAFFSRSYTRFLSRAFSVILLRDCADCHG